MRMALASKRNERAMYTATFVRFGSRPVGYGLIQVTAVFADVTDQEGTVVAEHQWFDVTAAMGALNLQGGDMLEFSARVELYARGYRGYREDIDKPYELDYRLVRPEAVRLVRRETAA